jgi:hypothetical protein
MTRMESLDLRHTRGVGRVIGPRHGRRRVGGHRYHGIRPEEILVSRAHGEHVNNRGLAGEVGGGDDHHVYLVAQP